MQKCSHPLALCLLSQRRGIFGWRGLIKDIELSRLVGNLYFVHARVLDIARVIAGAFLPAISAPFFVATVIWRAMSRQPWCGWKPRANTDRADQPY